MKSNKCKLAAENSISKAPEQYMFQKWQSHPLVVLSLEKRLKLKSKYITSKFSTLVKMLVSRFSYIDK